MAEFLRRRKPCYNPPMNPGPATGSSTSSDLSQIFRWSNPWAYALAGCFLLLILFGAHRIDDTDMGFHLRSGQWILQNHWVPTQEPYTYTVPSHEYLDMEWLYQVPLYLLYIAGGYTSISLVHIALMVLAFLLLFKRLRMTGTPWWICAFLLAAAVLASEIRCRVRPEILSWVLLGLTLWVLESRAEKKGDRLFWLPFIQWFWVNTEGLFGLGLGLMVFYWISNLVHTRKNDMKLLKFTGLSLAACLANPYFIRGLLFPLTLLSKLRLSDTNIFKFAVKEFQPPWSLSFPNQLLPPSYLLTYKFFCFFLLFLLLVTFRKRKIHEWLMALVFFGFSVSAMRNIPLFLLACAPLAATCWGELKWNWLRRFQEKFLSKPVCAWALALFLLGFSLRMVTNAHYVSRRLAERFGLGLDQSTLPVAACEYLIQNHLDGKVINTLDEGDWLDWKGPQKTFIDGRLEAMGEEFFTEYMQSMSPGALKPLLDKYQPDILFFHPLHAPQWVFEMKSMAGWRLVYVDSHTAIYLRQGYADNLLAVDYDRVLADWGVDKAILGNVDNLLQTPHPTSWVRFLEGFVVPAYYPDGLQNMGIFCARNDHLKEGKCFFLEAIRRTGGWYYDFYFNLGSMDFYLTQRYQEALTCMKRVLEDQPENPFALKVLQDVSRLR